MKLYERKDGLLYIRWTIKDKLEWSSTLEYVKTIPGRSFVPGPNYWTAPDIAKNRRLLKAAGFTPDRPKKVKIEDVRECTLTPDQLPKLRPYQFDNVAFTVKRGGRVLIGDDMGLGKTVSSLSYCAVHPKKRPILIIVTASTKIQWGREFKKWIDGNDYIEILYGKTPKALRPDVNYIINWDILFNWCGEKKRIKKINKSTGLEETKDVYQWKGPLLTNHFEHIIADEVQNVGNPKSQRTKAFIKLARKHPELQALSGTPFTSGPWQFFTILNLLLPQVFANRWKFYERYCDMKSNGFGVDFTGSSNEEELHSIISKVMIRHTKEEVLKELPPVQRIIVPLEVKDRKAYDDEKLKTFKKKFGEQDLIDLKDKIFDVKKEAVVLWIDEFLESGEKLFIGAWHRAAVDFIFKYYGKKAGRLYGGIGAKDRDAVIQRFIKDPKCRILVANLKSGGVGIDGLQHVCSNVATVELHANPSTHNQFDARIARMGQLKAVNSFYLMMDDSVELDAMRILDQKTESFSSIIDGVKVDKSNLMLELLKKYKGK